MAVTLVWFRQDLRLHDNPALQAARERGGVVPVFILDDAAEGAWAGGAASRWWLHHSLAALGAALAERGLSLVLRRGDSSAALRALVAETGATAVYWNRRYEPAARERDAAIGRELVAAGTAVETFNAALLHEPAEVANRAGQPFQVFSPFWRHCLTRPVPEARRLAPGNLPGPPRPPSSLPLGELELRPRIRWDTEIAATWEPGEAAARRQLQAFVAGQIDAYDENRNALGHDGTSRLSAALHFGEIGPRQVWAAVKAAGAKRGVFPPTKGAGVFLSEVGWREFAHHLLWHFPHTVEQPLRAEFARFPWHDDPGGQRLGAWQRGATGYPVVDAAMRQLWCTGWMHNRARMIAASFLVKHLRLPWLEGARWFWDTLVDADLASNTLGWQWTAGCGADAAPYFRIFAPVLQGRKFDADGAYVRRWVPELARLPDSVLHAPWEAPAEVLARANVRLGETYPYPIVEHSRARDEALAAFRALRPAAS